MLVQRTRLHIGVNAVDCSRRQIIQIEISIQLRCKRHTEAVRVHQSKHRFQNPNHNVLEARTPRAMNRNPSFSQCSTKSRPSASRERFATYFSSDSRAFGVFIFKLIYFVGNKTSIEHRRTFYLVSVLGVRKMCWTIYAKSMRQLIAGRCTHFFSAWIRCEFFWMQKFQHTQFGQNRHSCAIQPLEIRKEKKCAHLSMSEAFSELIISRWYFSFSGHVKSLDFSYVF